ncbi:MAG: hypothetical protein ACRCUY_09610 [Thermoguttaceae bacterium]
MNADGVREHGTTLVSGTWNISGFRNESRRFPTRYKCRCSRTGSKGVVEYLHNYTRIILLDLSELFKTP